MVPVIVVLGLALLRSVQTDVTVETLPRTCCNKQQFGKIYEYNATEFWGTRNISMSQYEGKQEPGANSTEIMNGIKYVRPGNGFEPNFQLMEKIEVNGANEHPIYTYLKQHCPPTRDGFGNKERLMYEPIKNTDLRWNWEKFLVNHHGQPVFRYDPSTDPEKIEIDIQNFLKLRNKNSTKFSSDSK